MQEQLKSCPFCGSNEIVLSNWGLYRCWCTNCLAKSSDNIRTKDAVEAWNRRYEQHEEIDFDYGAED